MSERRSFPPLLLIPAILLVALFYFMFKANQEKARVPKRSSPELLRSSDQQRLQKFKLTGFDDKGKSEWDLEGDSAKIDPGQTVFLDTHVTLRMKDDTVVRSENVEWSQDGGTLRTRAWVTVDHAGVKVKGRGAYGRPNEGFIQLNHDIEMVMNAQTHLVCTGPMKIFYNDNKMYFYRHVRVTDARGVLSADRMEVQFDEQRKKVRQIIAIGNVVIERDGDTTHSQRAVYSMETGSVRLEGSPEITLHKGGGILNGAVRN